MMRGKKKKRSRVKLVGYVTICCVIVSVVLIYPEETIDFFTITYSKNFVQIWRVHTKSDISRKDIRVDFCLMRRNGTVLGEPSTYGKGYVEFTEHPVAEFDTITMYLEKKGFIPLNITFVVPRIEYYLHGGQTYYSLAEVLMYPIPPIDALPWIVNYYCTNYTIPCCDEELNRYEYHD